MTFLCIRMYKNAQLRSDFRIKHLLGWGSNSRKWLVFAVHFPKPSLIKRIMFSESLSCLCRYHSIISSAISHHKKCWDVSKSCSSVKDLRVYYLRGTLINSLLDPFYTLCECVVQLQLKISKWKMIQSRVDFWLMKRR